MHQSLQNMHEFAPLDILLLPIGCKIFVTSKAQKWVGRLSQIVLVVFAFCELAADFVDLKTRTKFLILTQLSYILRVISSMLFVIVMSHTKEKTGLMIKLFVTDLTANQRSSLRRHAVICMVFSLSSRLIELIGTIMHLIFENVSLYHILSDSIPEIRYTMNQWFMTGCFIHTFFVKAVAFRHNNFFDRLHHTIRIQAHPDDAFLANECMRLRNQRDELMSCLMFVPICWFGLIFVELAAVVMESSEIEHSSVEQIMIVIPLAAYSLVLFYATFQADDVSNRLKKKIKAALSDIMSVRMTEKLPLLAHELENSMDSEFTAWSMFDINRKFVLSFISALITFTVLFIQITKSATSP